MQASKIIPKDTYALKLDKLVVRFDVTAVITVNTRTRGQGSPHDYTSFVDGFIHKADVPQGVVIPARETQTQYSADLYIFYRAKPDAVLGAYSEHMELVRRHAEERATAEAVGLANRERADAVRLSLYRLVGANVLPEKADAPGQMFSVHNYGRDAISISRDGIEALHRALVARDEDAA